MSCSTDSQNEDDVNYLSSYSDNEDGEIDENNDDLDKAKRHIYETYSNESKLESMNKKFDMIKVKNSNTLIYKLILNAN